MPSWPLVSFSVARFAICTTGAAAFAIAARSLGDAEDRHDARIERTRREDDLVGPRNRFERARGRLRVGRAQPDLADAVVRAGLGDRDLALHLAVADARPQPTPDQVLPAAPSFGVQQAAGLFERGGEIAHRLGEPDDHDVAERVVFEFARTKPVFECGGPRPFVVRERDEAAAQIAGRGHVEVAPQPAGAPAVVGDAHDRGDVARVLADRAQRDRKPMTTPECYDTRRHVRSRSRSR